MEQGILTSMRVRRSARWLAAILSLLIALPLSSCQREPPGGFARVIAVRDGDTIELDDGRVVRYIGINTPERGEPGADSATALNVRLVMGQQVRLEFGHELTDRYGRTLAFVYVGERMVNRELVRAGWAPCYFFEQNLQHAPELVRDLQEAMRAKRGLWHDPTRETADHYVASFTSFRFHRPDCLSVTHIDRDDEVIFRVRDSALFAGYSPCGHCQP
jgi:micrococcal nuclease